jgi:hypothetical protein
MTEEVKQEEAVVVEQEQQVEKQTSPIEERALEMGWRPREEFEGDEEDFIDAKEFVRRKPLFDKIESVSRESKTLRKALDSLKSHYTKVRETEYQKALRDLKQEQKQALADGDVDRFYAIEDEQKLVEQEKAVFMEAQAQIQTEPQQVHPEFAAWVDRNRWYETQPHMQTFADGVGARLQGAVRAGTMTPAQVLKEIEKAVRDEFPTRFRNPNKDKPAAVEGSVRSGTSSTKEPVLSDEERQIMNTLVRGGHLTKEQYLADLKRAKEQK